MAALRVRAFCEGRRASGGDSGDIDVLLNRSYDKGAAWTDADVIADAGTDTVGNPTPVVERRSGTNFLLLTRNPGHVRERQIADSSAEGTRTAWLTRSSNDGRSWSPLEEVTSTVKLRDWTWYATGPGSGIQLRSGHLVVPCDHTVKGTHARHSHVICSDDRAKTWYIGGVADEKTNESAVVELSDGSLLLNMRDYHGQNRRAVARSRDRGATWSSVYLDPPLIEPVSQARLIGVTPSGKRRRQWLLFSNPANVKRAAMTVRASFDQGKTWPVARLVHAGPAACSSLAVLGDGSGLLYERGDASAYERITFARFPLKWCPPRSCDTFSMPTDSFAQNRSKHFSNALIALAPTASTFVDKPARGSCRWSNSAGAWPKPPCGTGSPLPTGSRRTRRRYVPALRAS